MMDACINTIVRNGSDTIKFCLESVLPYAKRAIVWVDERSSDKTMSILQEMDPKIEVAFFKNKDPVVDLVKARNEQLALVKEKYVWIVDSDEFYPKETLEKLWPCEDVYAFRCWAPWDGERAHRASSKPFIPRIFRMKPERRWEGLWGKENLLLPEDTVAQFPYRYIHFTHFKKDNWREEMNQQRVADDQNLIFLPPEIKSYVEEYQKMQNVWGDRIQESD